MDANLGSLKDNAGRQAIVARLQANLAERVRRGLGILMAAVGRVLLIACGNLANLLLSRGLARRKEIAVRAALGAGRWQIVRQFFSESLGLSFLGGALGALFAEWTLGAMLTQLPQALPHRAAISIDARALAFCFALTLACAVMFATLPAWRFSQADPQDALSQSMRGTVSTRSSSALQRWLVGFQIALCTMLLIASDC